MSILRAYRTELDPNRASCLLFLRHAGTARFAYNWGLERLSEAHRAQIKPPSKFYLNRELNRLKRNELAWLYEVSAHAPAEGLRDLHRAYDNFLRNGARLAKRPMAKGRRPRKDGMPKGFPRFKSRKHGVGGFRLRGHIHVFKDAIELPRIGRIRLKERGYLPTEGVKVLSATVSERAGRWFVSLHVEQVIKAPKNDGPVVGIDLGILRLITVSDGTFISNPRALPKYQRKLKRLQRSAARKNVRSRNQARTIKRVARCHLRITNIRRDAIHKATTMLARTKSCIGVESLGVQGMMKNHCLAGALADASFGEILRQLRYKTEWYGSGLVPAKPDFPSTRRCSRCEWIKPQLTLSQRWFRCGRCGFEADRDLMQR